MSRPLAGLLAAGVIFFVAQAAALRLGVPMYAGLIGLAIAITLSVGWWTRSAVVAVCFLGWAGFYFLLIPVSIDRSVSVNLLTSLYRTGTAEVPPGFVDRRFADLRAGGLLDADTGQLTMMGRLVAWGYVTLEDVLGAEHRPTRTPVP